MMFAKVLLDLARPFLRRSPRFTGFAYRTLGGVGHDERWTPYGQRITRGTEHGYNMVLDLDHWSQRAAYYQGRFYDLAAQRVIRRILGPGDIFVDVGANIGMLTLAAAAVVGREGTILAFEPNADARARLRQHVEMNRLAQVQVFDLALSSERGESILTMPTDSSGRSTLRQENSAAHKTFSIQTAMLDDFVDHIPSDRRVLVKIDTEGFELNVLKGASRLLARPHVAVLAEITDAWLRELGQSAKMLFDFMANRGYVPYHPYMRPRGWRQDLIIEPVSLPGPHHQFDALFIHKDHETMLAR